MFAPQEHQLILHYQPRYNITHRRILSVEALLRWNHPEHGIIMPDTFIPKVEKDGTILQIDAWVLHEALRQLKQWREMNFDLRISVNISSRQCENADFLKMVLSALEETHVLPSLLEIEITEYEDIKINPCCIRLIHSIRERGVRIALDDFGTGFSSLSRLLYFPVDAIKIDKTFIKNIEHDPKSRILTHSMISMAKNMDIIAIAEGVETAEQMNTAVELGAHEIQGFWYAKPVSANDLVSIYAQQMVHTANG